MIDEYLRAARRTKPTSEAMVTIYCEYYNCIQAQDKSCKGHPELFVTYSSERRCELVRLNGNQHLVYDQYLGQSFNRLNRIQFAKHRPDLLSMSYACKFIAERLAALNAIAPAALLALMSRQFEKDAHAEGNPFDDVDTDEGLRQQLTAAQELFVMSHELAHHRWAADQISLSSSIETRLEEFFKLKGERTPDTETLKPSSEYYRAILDSSGPEFLEEIFADDFGGAIAMRAALEFGVQPWIASLGSILAFKYLRLFRHLEILSHRIAALTQSDKDSDFSFGLDSLENDVWDEETGGIKRFQLREHFLRHRLQINRRALPEFETVSNSKIETVIDNYDEKTESPSIFGIVDCLKRPLTADLLRQIEGSMRSGRTGLDIIDRLTGWEK